MCLIFIKTCILIIQVLNRFHCVNLFVTLSCSYYDIPVYCALNSCFVSKLFLTIVKRFEVLHKALLNMVLLSLFINKSSKDLAYNQTIRALASIKKLFYSDE